MLGNMNIVAKNDESDTLVAHKQKSPGKSSSKSKRTKNGRGSLNNSPSSHKKKNEHFGSIPKIPQKVVEVVQLDVVESYGPMDEVNYDTAEKEANSNRRIVAAQKTTLFEAQEQNN